MTVITAKIEEGFFSNNKGGTMNVNEKFGNVSLVKEKTSAKELVFNSSFFSLITISYCKRYQWLSIYRTDCKVNLPHKSSGNEQCALKIVLVHIHEYTSLQHKRNQRRGEKTRQQIR